MRMGERLRPVARKFVPARFRDWYMGRPTIRRPVPPAGFARETLDPDATLAGAEAALRSASRELGELVAATLPPEGDSAYVDTLYRLILRRAADADTLKAAHRHLSEGSLTRARLVEELIGSAEFAELRLLEDLLKDLRGEPRAFSVQEGSPIGPGTTERIIEIPWMLSRWRGEPRVLDAGYAFAPRAYLTALLDLRIPCLHGVDMGRSYVPGMRRTQADLRALPYKESAFDLVICISTLEHIGLDNARYGLPRGPRDERAQLRCMLEMARVLRPRGRLLISVPLGRRGDYGWFIQYDWRMWRTLVRRTPLEIEEQQQFRLDPDGWTPVVSPRATEDLLYADGVPGAKAVLCASLLKPG